MLSDHLASYGPREGVEVSSRSEGLKCRGRDACPPGEWCGSLATSSARPPASGPPALPHGSPLTGPLGRTWSGEMQTARHSLLDTLSSERGSVLGWDSPTGPLWVPGRLPPGSADPPRAHHLILHHPTPTTRGQPLASSLPRSRGILCAAPALLPTAPGRPISLIGKAKVLSSPRRPSLTGPPLTAPPTLFPSVPLTNSGPLNVLAPQSASEQKGRGFLPGDLFSQLSAWLARSAPLKSFAQIPPCVLLPRPLGPQALAALGPL